MKTIKGPAIFIAQFIGDKEPFNNLTSICKWAKGLGYKAVQLPTNDPRFIDLMSEVFDRGNIVLHIDDMYGVIEGYHIPTILRKLWTSGRKKNIAIQALIQSARGFDKIIMRQSEDIDVFYMQDADEREYLAHSLGHTDLAKAAPKFAHWSHTQGDLVVRLVGALPEYEVR